MPYTLKFEQDGSVAVVTWQGTVSAAEIVGINRELYAPGCLGRLRCQVWDFTTAVKAVSGGVTADDIRLFVMQDRAALAQNPHLTLLLVGRPEFFSGMQDIYQAYAGVWAASLPTHVLHTMDEARCWLASHLSPGESALPVR